MPPLDKPYTAVELAKGINIAIMNMLQQLQWSLLQPLPWKAAFLLVEPEPHDHQMQSDWSVKTTSLRSDWSTEETLLTGKFRSLQEGTSDATTAGSWCWIWITGCFIKEVKSSGPFGSSVISHLKVWKCLCDHRSYNCLTLQSTLDIINGDPLQNKPI